MGVAPAQDAGSNFRLNPRAGLRYTGVVVWKAMILFFAVMISMQAVIYAVLCTAFRLSTRHRAVTGVFLSLMVFAPIWNRMLDKAGYDRAARIVGVLGHTWMVAAFWFCIIVVALLVWNLLARLFLQGRWRVRPRASAFLALSLVALGLAWGFVEGSRIQVKEILIQTPRLTPDMKPIRIVQISDLHLGKPRGYRFAGKVRRLVEELKPDLLVSTGDLIDSTFGQVSSPAAVFRDLDPPLGKLAVTGNHEYYTGLKTALAFHREAGFRVLQSEAVQVAPSLVVVGVDDPAGAYTDQPSRVDERRPLRSAGTAFVILLKHEPRVRANSIGFFDLQLSGHTHGGQVFPFRWIVRLFYRHVAGMYRISDRSLLYVTRGTGVWGAPLRVLAPAEITVIVIAPAEAGA